MSANPAISNIHVTYNGGDLISIGWQTRDARFHIWSRNSMTGDITTLFKNPLVERGHSDYFDTRRLDASKPGNVAIIAIVMDAVKRGDMMNKAKVAYEAEQAAAEQAQNAMTARREHGQELFKLMRNCIASGQEFYTLTADDVDALLSYAPANE